MAKKPSDTGPQTSDLPPPVDGAEEPDTWDDWMDSALDSFASEVSEAEPPLPAPAPPESQPVRTGPPAPAADAEPIGRERPEDIGRSVDAPLRPMPPDSTLPGVAARAGASAPPELRRPTLPEEDNVSARLVPRVQPSAIEPAAPAVPAPPPVSPSIFGSRAVLEPSPPTRPLPLDREDVASRFDPPEDDGHGPGSKPRWREAGTPLAGVPAAPVDHELEDARESWWSRVAASLKQIADRRPSTESGTTRQLRFDFSPTHLAVVALVVIGLAELAVIGWHLFAGGPSGPSGLVHITSRPAGALLLIDGEPQGVTPATIRVPEGLHALELRSSGPAQVIALHVDKDVEIARFFDLPVGTAGAALRVDTGAAGARVLVDGKLRGRSPLTVSDLNPGSHIVRVESGPHWLQSVVTLEPGVSDAITLSLPDQPGSPSEGHGWLTLTAPMELRVSKNGALVGTTKSGPLQLAAGRHDLEFVSEPFGVRLTRTVDVADGRTTAVDLALQPGLLSITANPPGQITIDGEAVGATPVMKRPLPAGQHDIIVRHGQLGERRLMITMTAGAALAVTVDFRR